ncbi:zinc-binding oxidoreductase [Stagonosporopsis vannaccii]|nr:zinc-binding oxidoreductase [Stagonosporopsis vannaccii]
MGSLQQNKAAYLDEPGASLVVRDAPLPKAGPGEIVVRNAAISINPVDWHMQDSGLFIHQWPAVIGCDVAGEVYDSGPDVDLFKVGDRVIGHAITMWSGRPQDGAFQLYTVLSVDKAAKLPPTISFTDGVVLPLALETAICALHFDRRNPLPEFLPGVYTPALALPYPSLKDGILPSTNKTLVVYGGSSSVGSVTTQLAAAAGIHVISIAGVKNFDLSKRSGASECCDHKDPLLVDRVVEAVRKSGNEFIGIVDAISILETIARDLEILEQLGGGHLALTHPHMGEEVVLDSVEIGMVWSGGINETSSAVWKAYVGSALQSGKLKCLPPPTVVGKGLGNIQEALKLSKKGVSGTKLVVEL